MTKQSQFKAKLTITINKEKYIRNKVMISIIIGSVLINGCSSMKKSLVTGVSLGAATGAVTGSISNKNNRNKGAFTGALIGAAVGGLSSYIIHGSLQSRDTQIRKSTLLNLDKYSVSRPQSRGSVEDFKLSRPDIDKECFDWEVKGGKLVQKHCVWTIKGNSFWVPSGR